MIRFIVDAQLPKSLSDLLNENGFDSIHTTQLKHKNQTTDLVIKTITIKEKRILITKDSDFEDSHLINKVPPKLVLVSTGNIQNKDLLKLFVNNLLKILKLITDNHFIEINRDKITVHS